MPAHPAASSRGSGSKHNSGGGGRGANPLAKSQERIYSAQQLVQALKSALAALRDQLNVLTILDGSAMAWPGLSQAVDDLEFLVDMSGQTTGRLENDQRNMEQTMQNCQQEVATLKETLAMANQTREDLQQELSQCNKDLKTANNKLEASNKEKDQQRQVHCGGYSGLHGYSMTGGMLHAHA